MAFWPPATGACRSTVVHADGGNDGTVRLWNPATGQPAIKTLQTGSGPAGGMSAVALSPSGKLLARGCGDGTVRLWNPATGRVATLHAKSRTVYGSPPSTGRVPR